jgi:hypothetical protein
MTSRFLAALLPLALIVACSGSTDPGVPIADAPVSDASDSGDSGSDAKPDTATPDTSPDAVPDTKPDTHSDTAVDTGVDTDPSFDTGVDTDPSLDTGADTDPPFDTGFDTSVIDTGPADGGSCNTLAYAGPAISLELSSASPPTLTGGTIVAGTYVLAKCVFYTTSLPATLLRQTLQISGTTVEALATSGSDPDQRTTSTIATVGATATLTRTCPGAGTDSVAQYQASSTSLEFVFDSGTIKGYFRYDRK